MATPYFQLRLESVPSTQDVARDNLGELPVLVMSPDQSKGRGRAGDEWITAERAVAVSLAFKCKDEDTRPFSLMAGVAATQVAKRTRLKWPNDVMLGDLKVGGILVERSADVVVVGLGLNLWWPDPPEGMAGLLGEDPGDDRYAEVAGLWGAEFMRLMDSDGSPMAGLSISTAVYVSRSEWTSPGILTERAVPLGSTRTVVWSLRQMPAVKPSPQVWSDM